MTGPLMTNEVQGKHLFWIKDAQQAEDKQRLGLEVNDEGIFDCPGQIRDISPSISQSCIAFS